MLTAERLRELLDYDPKTGLFERKKKIGRGAKKPWAGTFDKRYIRICVDGKQYGRNRLAWLYMTGEWPTLQVDHINGDKCDDRWINLREVTNGQNMQNQTKASSRSQTGFLGVQRNGSGFQAIIQTDGVRKCLGTYRTAEEAHAMYLKAKAVLHISAH